MDRAIFHGLGQAGAWATGLLLGCLGLPGTALAGDSPPPNGIHAVRFDVHGDFGGYGSLGAGFRVDIPIVRGGFINGVDDELALSPGLDVFFSHFYYDYYHGAPYFIPSIVVQWNFYLGSHWSVFPEVGLAFYVGDDHYLRRGVPFYPVPDFGVGARYHFSARNALLLRISTPTGFQVGITF
jgi:hypothetical protein